MGEAIDYKLIKLTHEVLVFCRNKLQENKDDTEDRIKDCEDVNENLKSQLTAITQQLLNTEGELNLSKSELQNCRQEIEVRDFDRN